MKTTFLKSFFKDLDKLPSENVLIEIRKTIENVEKAIQISQISDLKKLKSFKNAYRIRIGDYRIGVFIEKGIVEFARILHRKNIYKVFP